MLNPIIEKHCKRLRVKNEVSKSLDVSESALRRWVAVAKEPEDSDNSRIKELEADAAGCSKHVVYCH